MPDLSNLFGTTGISNLLKSPFLNPLVWVIIIVVIVGFTFTVVKLRKRRKLCYPAAEIVDLGNGNTSLNFLGNHGAGWFGKKRILFGLWDTGADIVMRIKTMDVVEQFSEMDFHEVNGKRGVVFYRDPVTKSLLPISKLVVTNKELLNTLAPVEFKEQAVDIIKANEVETKDKLSQYAPMIVMTLMIIGLVIAIIIISQMNKNAIAEAKDLILQAGNTCLSAAKQVCSQFGLPASGAAP